MTEMRSTRSPVEFALVGLLAFSIALGCGPGSGSSYRAHYSSANGFKTKTCIERVKRATDVQEELLSCRGVWLSPYPCDATDEDEQADFCEDESSGGDGEVVTYVLAAIALVALVVVIALNPDSLAHGPSDP